MLKSRKVVIGIGTLVVLLAGVGVAAQQTDIYFLIKKNFNIFSKTYEKVALEYVDEVDPEMLMRTGMEAMLETLDPYTVMYSESQNEQAEIRSRGNYAGVGIDAGYRDGKVVVMAPVEGGPAEKVGIRTGDVIVAVDGVLAEGLQPEEVKSLLSGEVGSEVEITIDRYGLDQVLDFTLVRERIELSNVSYSGLMGSQENVGYIKLTQFGRNSAEEIRTSILEFSEQREIDGLVLDLRDNPGGILQEAVAIIDKFIEPGITAVETRGRVAEYNQTFPTEQPVMFDKPVVVLMSNGSASASEVVAGALQDLDRALILGEQSFGKGLVQIVKPLPYNTSLKITISRYYIPSGRSIQSIQYTHKGRNSAVISEASEQKQFKTRNGRIVYEGRGIEPDVEIEKEELSLLEVTLLREGMYFDFATQFEAANSTFEVKRLPDKVYNAFLKFLDSKDFDYTTNSEQLLEKLEAELEKVKGAQAQIKSLRESIAKEKEQLLKEAEDNIRRTLYLELISRYKGQSGKVEAGLRLDPQVLKAIEFINNPGQMNDILSGQ
ncbi:MAG: S41 family peptidase [Balneolaceae bacterium]|nr:S41 family peptidase [Balneolaceae bacterium]